MENFTAQERKERPVYTGVIKYFPDALLEVALLSKVGNDQHNPGQPLHWAKEKSTDELDALLRHAMDAGTRDTDGMRHSAKVAWRALANLQREIEAERAQPVVTPPTPAHRLTVDDMQRGHVLRHDSGELPTPPSHYEGDFASDGFSFDLGNRA